MYPYPWDDEFYGPALIIGGGDGYHGGALAATVESVHRPAEEANPEASKSLSHNAFSRRQALRRAIAARHPSPCGGHPNCTNTGPNTTHVHHQRQRPDHHVAAATNNGRTTAGRTGGGIGIGLGGLGIGW